MREFRDNRLRELEDREDETAIIASVRPILILGTEINFGPIQRGRVIFLFRVVGISIRIIANAIRIISRLSLSFGWLGDARVSMDSAWAVLVRWTC